MKYNIQVRKFKVTGIDKTRFCGNCQFSKEKSYRSERCVDCVSDEETHKPHWKKKSHNRAYETPDGINPVRCNCRFTTVKI